MGHWISSNSGQKPSGRNNWTLSTRDSTDNSGNETEWMYDTKWVPLKAQKRKSVQNVREPFSKMKTGQSMLSRRFRKIYYSSENITSGMVVIFATHLEKRWPDAAARVLRVGSVSVVSRWYTEPQELVAVLDFHTDPESWIEFVKHSWNIFQGDFPRVSCYWHALLVRLSYTVSSDRLASWTGCFLNDSAFWSSVSCFSGKATQFSFSL